MEIVFWRLRAKSDPKSGNSVALLPGYIQTRSTGDAIDRLRQWLQSYTLDRVTERSFLDVFRISVWDYFRFTKIENNPAPRFEKQPKNSKRFSFGYLSTNNSSSKSWFSLGYSLDEFIDQYGGSHRKPPVEWEEAEPVGKFKNKSGGATGFKGFSFGKKWLAQLSKYQDSYSL